MYEYESIFNELEEYKILFTKGLVNTFIAYYIPYQTITDLLKNNNKYPFISTLNIN